jgi:hypothetical protein
MIEAVGLAEEAETFTAETGVEMGFLIALFEDARGNTPDDDLAEAYHEEINTPDLPVLSDIDEGILDATSYAGSPLPGKCVLSPEMKILLCSNGHGNETVFDVILDHADR